MRFVVLAMVALLFLNCASSSTPAYELQNRIRIYHENLTHYDTTVYLLNGNSRRRIIRCPGLGKCNYWLQKHQAQRVLSQGYIDLGWRVGSQDPLGSIGKPLHGSGRLGVVYDGMTVVIRIGTINTWIYPGAGLKQAKTTDE